MLLMLGAAKNASSTLDSLSNWMLAGFGGALGLILPQLQGLAPILPADSVRWAGLLYITSVLPAFVAKIIGMAVNATATGATDGAALGEKIAAWGPLDVGRLHQEIGLSTPWPLSWLNRKPMELAVKNDLAAMGRLSRDRAALQMRLVILQTTLTAAAGLVLILGLKTP